MALEVLLLAYVGDIVYILVFNKYMEKFEYKSVTIYYTREIDYKYY